jgi:hypothetical protein
MGAAFVVVTLDRVLGAGFEMVFGVMPFVDLTVGFRPRVVVTTLTGGVTTASTVI